MNDYDPISPYLRRRIRSLEEAQKDQLTASGTRHVVFRALEQSRARGDNPQQQFQHAVEALLAACTDLEEAVAVDSVHRLLKEEDDAEEEAP